MRSVLSDVLDVYDRVDDDLSPVNFYRMHALSDDITALYFLFCPPLDNGLHSLFTDATLLLLRYTAFQWVPVCQNVLFVQHLMICDNLLREIILKIHLASNPRSKFYHTIKGSSRLGLMSH